MSIIGIDQSKRSTAATCIDLNGKMVDQILITPGAEYDKEYLIKYQWELLHSFIETHKINGLSAIALEGAAFGAEGASNDLLWGIQWFFRTQILLMYPDLYSGVIPVTSWRSKVLTVKEQKEFKSLYGGKIGLKHGVISKLPEDVKKSFDNYLEMHKNRINVAKGLKDGSKSLKYMEGMFDLADSWGIANYRLSLMPKKPTLSSKRLVRTPCNL